MEKFGPKRATPNNTWGSDIYHMFFKTKIHTEFQRGARYSVVQYSTTRDSSDLKKLYLCVSTEIRGDLSHSLILHIEFMMKPCDNAFGH